MPYTPPSFEALVAQLVALAQSKIQVSVGGVNGQPDLTEGSDILTQLESQAFLQDFFNNALVQFYTDHDFSQATGAALANLLAPRNLQPIPAGYAIVPVLCAVNAQSAGTGTQAQQTIIPAATATQAAYRFLAADQTGALTIAFAAMQNPFLPAGQAGVRPTGASSVWVLAMAEVAGSAGNVAAGSIRGIGSAVLAGLDTVSNPPVASTAAPVVTPGGTPGGTPGAATNQYAVVARGQQGRALMSAAGTTTTAPAVLTAINFNSVTWQPVDNASGYDVLTLVGASWMLLGSVLAGTTSLNDTGQTPQAYSVPLAADANAGAGGTDPESDTAFRARALATAIAGGGGGSDDALVTAALGIAGVTAAFVVDNPTAGTCTLSYVAQPNPLPPLLARQLGAQVDQAAAAGAMTTVQQVTPTPVAVAYTYVPTRGAPATTISNVNAAITAYFGTLAPGSAVRDSALAAAMQAVVGVDHIVSRTYTVTGGGVYTNADTAGQSGILYSAGPLTVTTGG